MIPSKASTRSNPIFSTVFPSTTSPAIRTTPLPRPIILQSKVQATRRVCNVAHPLINVKAPLLCS